MEKLNKYSAPEVKIDEVIETDDGQGGNIPDLHMTPKSAVGTKAGVEPRPHSGMDSLAMDAKERLSNLFSTTPAGSTAPPRLPPLPVQSRHEDDANKEPSVASPTLVASDTGKKAADAGLGLSGQQLLDLITRLTSKDADGEKPRTKEAETIKRTTCPHQKPIVTGVIMSEMKSSQSSHAPTNPTRLGSGSMKFSTTRLQGNSWRKSYRSRKSLPCRGLAWSCSHWRVCVGP